MASEGELVARRKPSSPMSFFSWSAQAAMGVAVRTTNGRECDDSSNELFAKLSRCAVAGSNRLLLIGCKD